MRLDPPPVRRRRMSLTPIIDVVFLLLLFFMLASTFSRYAHVDIAVAGRTAPDPAPDATAILLTVRQDGFAVNGTPAARGGIEAALTQAAGGRQVKILIRPSDGAPVENIVYAVEQAQISRLGPVVLVR